MLQHLLGRWPLFLITVAPMALSACAGLPPGHSTGTGRVTATLLTDGEAVRVNHDPATAGQPINSGDLVTTQPGSAAEVRFSDGTRVVLDENTDPVLSWSGDTLYIRTEDGAIEVVTGAVLKIVHTVGELADFFSWSHVIVEERRGRFFRADLLAGHMQITRPSRGPVQAAGDYFLVRPGGAAVEYGRTSPEQQRKLLRRFQRWHFAAAKPIRMPDLRKQGFREALQELSRAGLQLGRTTGATSGERFVVEQRPAPGTRMRSGDRVDLELAARPEPGIKTPRVLKFRLREAIATLERAGLKIGRISGGNGGDSVYVTGQSPSPGAVVPRGSKVNLSVRGVIE